MDLIFGRWRSQTVYAGAALGVFDHIASDHSIETSTIAMRVGADSHLLYRLLRALASIGLLSEDDGRAFRLTDAGSFLRADHPQSLRGMVLLEEGPEHYAIWKHLVAMLLDGKQNGFVREFGTTGYELALRNPEYGSVFNRAMSSYSALETRWTIAALAGVDVSAIRTLCDVAGGHGHLLCGFLDTYPHLTGLVLDLPQVVSETSRLWAPQLGLSERCRYIGGDMFKEVPAADAYLLKHALHDWNDVECSRLLTNLGRAVIDRGRVFIIERIIAGPEQPDFAKLFDIHMMCGRNGRERTTAEYCDLLATAGWQYVATHRSPEAPLAVIEAIAA